MQDSDLCNMPLRVTFGAVLDCKGIAVRARQKLDFEALLGHALGQELKQVGLGELSICLIDLAATHFDEVSDSSKRRRLTADPLIHGLINRRSVWA
jgi:hypothetical protein